jgi:putative ABC transport system ATP-binding protein
MESILLTKNLSKTYRTEAGELHALQGVDLAIRPGELVAVMGPSGCGKSTLLHLLGGLDSPTGGEVYVADQRIDTMNETRRAILRRRQIGFVFQAFNLISNLTVRDNVELPALLAGASTREARQRCARLLGDLGLADKGRAVPGQLSGGEQQRVALARALVNHPAILLADEPTGNLDSTSAYDVLELLRRYHAQGQTILLVTHDPGVASVSERVITMRDGHIKDETELHNRQGVRDVLAQVIQLEV